MHQSLPFKDHWTEQRLFLSRLIAAVVVILLLTSVLVGRLFQLQVVEHQQFADLSQGNRLRIEALPPTRGLIFDRNGVVLAQNLPTYSLEVVPESVREMDALIDQIDEVLEENAEEFVKNYVQRGGE